MSLRERFIQYVSMDTMSEENSSTFPSSKSQLEFGKLLVQDLLDLGLKDAYQDENGYVYAHLDGNKTSPRIGFIAHMDTSPSLKGGNYTPKIIENYDGKDIELCPGVILSKKQFPSLKKHIHHDLIVTDGQHLLGGDDKAGITIIMELLEYYHKNPQKNHAPISICFTPDEEIGNGASRFDIKKMKADYAYTIDGGAFNDINYENFNAASCEIEIQGVGVHPGFAKNIMVNALLVGSEFISSLPKKETPAKTEGYEGFYHLTAFSGTPEKATLSYILRDHDGNKLEKRMQKMYEIGTKLSQKYKTAKIKVSCQKNYQNMRTYFDKNMRGVLLAVEAFKQCGIEPTFTPIRGGTDGATITFMGLPCPNLGTGDYNCHGRYEYVSLQEMTSMVRVLKQLVEMY